MIMLPNVMNFEYHYLEKRIFLRHLYFFEYCGNSIEYSGSTANLVGNLFCRKSEAKVRSFLKTLFSYESMALLDQILILR